VLVLLAIFDRMAVTGRAYPDMRERPMSILKSLFGRKNADADSAQNTQTEPAPQESNPTPDQPIFVIGDLHGRVDLLENMLELIDLRIGELRLNNPRLVFVGNLMDHGPGSADVVRRMRELTHEFPTNVQCLLGSNEQMCLDFLEAPVARQARWLKDGGAMTLQSYAVALPGQEPQEAERWMRSLPSLVSNGNLHVVHAAADPRRAMTDQADRVLTWGHPEFLGVARNDDQWVAHGHSVVEQPEIKDGRISVNTEAWKTSVLSAAMILPDGRVDFLQTKP